MCTADSSGDEDGEPQRFSPWLEWATLSKSVQLNEWGCFVWGTGGWRESVGNQKMRILGFSEEAHKFIGGSGTHRCS